MNGKTVNDMIEIQLNSSINSLKRLKDMISSYIKIKGDKMRLFNHRGLDLDESDIDYLNNSQVIYVSDGKNFNSVNYINEYQFIKNIKSGGYGMVYLGMRILILSKESHHK